MHPHDVNVYYDGHCPFCVRSKNILEKLDRLHVLHFISFRELSSSEMPFKPTEMERAMAVVYGNHKASGMHAVSKLLQRIPEMFPFYALVTILNFLGLGERIYDRISISRYSFLIGRCSDECITSAR